MKIYWLIWVSRKSVQWNSCIEIWLLWACCISMHFGISWHTKNKHVWQISTHLFKTKGFISRLFFSPRQFRRHLGTHLDLSASYCRLNVTLTQNLLYNQNFLIFPVVVYGCETWPLTLRGEPKLRVFENRVLRRIFGPKRDEVTGEWRKLHYKELNYLYCSPNIFRVIKSRRMRWAGNVARMVERRGYTRTEFWWGNWGKDLLEDPGLDSRIILRWIFRKSNVGAWTGSSWLRIGTGGGHLWMR